MPIKLNTTIKTQLLLALLISLWLVAFLVFIAPFDASDVPLSIRWHLMPPYGVLFFGCYAALLPLQNRLYHRFNYWSIGLESVFLILLFIVMLPLLFAYYKTDIVNGTFTFLEFSTTVYLPILLIISPILIFGRWIITRYNTPPIVKEVIVEKIHEFSLLVLKGDNKTDVLQIEEKCLVAVSSAQNYVEIYYWNEDNFEKKLLRSTLKKIQEQAPFLVQIHRSHLIHPLHFVGWNDGATIQVSNLDLPVSQGFKKKVNQLF